MSGYNNTLITAQVDGTALSNSAVATSIIPPAARLAIPANYFFIGKTLIIEATGRMSTVVTTPGTLALTVNLGASGTTNVFAPAAMALNVVAQTNATWWARMKLTCRAIGTSANLMGVGRFISRALLNAPAAGTTLGVGEALLPDTAPVVGGNFDSTVTNILDFFATFSIANASNSIQLHEYSVTDLTFTP